VALEATLSLLIGHAGEGYIVVNGPKGAGKSSVVNSVQSFGVVSLSLRSSDTHGLPAKFVDLIRHEILTRLLMCCKS
jgi:ABC-type branched-subunit amino acid transport system ATPase component